MCQYETEIPQSTPGAMVVGGNLQQIKSDMKS